MSDASDSATPEGTQDDETPVIRDLREKAKQIPDLQSSNEALLRENTMLKAGVPETAIGKMFAGSYSGELTVDAVKEGWSAVAAELAPPPPAPEPPPSAEVQAEQVVQVSPEEQAAQQIQDLISGGAPPEATPSNHPGMDGAKLAHELIQTGSHPDEAFGAWLGSVLTAHNSGDERATTERRGGFTAI